jgi:hypothetical protein
VAQVVESLPSKCDALSSNSIPKKKKKSWTNELGVLVFCVTQGLKIREKYLKIDNQ